MYNYKYLIPEYYSSLVYQCIIAKVGDHPNYHTGWCVSNNSLLLSQAGWQHWWRPGRAIKIGIMGFSIFKKRRGCLIGKMQDEVSERQELRENEMVCERFERDRRD